MIDLCVVNYNTIRQVERLVRFLNSDTSYKDRPWTLYVADNDSKDGSKEWLCKMQSIAGIEDLLLNDNIGYAAACNALASLGSGDIIALLNSDVWMTSEDVSDIQKIFDENPDIHILGPKQRDENGKITHAGIGGTLDAPKHRGWHHPDPDDTLFRDRAKMVTVSGAAYFIRREVWEALGSDPEYINLVKLLQTNNLLDVPIHPLGPFLPTKHYYEETFCSYFAQHKGYNVYYDGSVSIGHSWHASHERGSRADLEFAKSKKLFVLACDYFGIAHD